MAKHGEAGKFVTVLPISEKGTSHAQIRSHSGIPLPKRPASAPNVTVLEVKNTAGPFNGTMASEVLDHATIYRLPGERLGMALKFVGGTNAGDTVSKVFIQSINPESPASRAQSKFAPIREGDEILKIGEREVTSMTRLDCVTLLRDAPVCINLVIRHMGGYIQLPVEPPTATDTARNKREPPPIPPRKTSAESPPILVMKPFQYDVITALQRTKCPNDQYIMLSTYSKSPSTKSLDRIGNGSIVRPSIPPPLPPRKVSKEDTTNQSSPVEVRSQSVPPPPPPRKDDHKLNQQRTTYSADEPDGARTVLQRTRSAPSSEERPRFLRPAEAEAYTDLFADDDDNYVDESDDTASSVSTVIDRLHSRSSTANSSFSEHAYGYDRPPLPRFELERAMHPLMEMEQKMPEVPPRPSVQKLQAEDTELSETPDPQPAAEISEVAQEKISERSVEASKSVSATAVGTEDPKCQIIAAKCQSPLLDGESKRARKIIVEP
ncbi:uncharacterized protein LOC108863848 [Galendromus occidentalis]|uniref:Uncharacterized protein LOC108863848 n=1 Tax=Galendromus occidentalis TaxID=34638 RepID=A0AAJ7L3V8_9ACAR|nr:uncharacterized protein LOC108863848 [Galendromus occidentalis]